MNRALALRVPAKWPAAQDQAYPASWQPFSSFGTFVAVFGQSAQSGNHRAIVCPFEFPADGARPHLGMFYAKDADKSLANTNPTLVGLFKRRIWKSACRIASNGKNRESIRPGQVLFPQKQFWLFNGKSRKMTGSTASATRCMTSPDARQ